MADDPMETMARTFVLSHRYRKEVPGEIADVDVFGQFGATTKAVRSTSMSLLLSPGRYSYDQRAATIPFVHVNVEGSTAIEGAEDIAPMIDAVFPLENAALLVVNLAYDIKHVTAQMIRMAGRDDLEKQRLRQVRHFAANAAHEALNTVYLLDHILEDEDESPAAQRQTPPKTKLRAKTKSPSLRKPPTRKASL